MSSHGVNSRLYGSSFGNINTLYSYIYIKSDTLGTLNWGHLSPASDNPAVLADISGTVIESNFVFFEGGGFQLKAKNGGPGNNGTGLAWNNFCALQLGSRAWRRLLRRRRTGGSLRLADLGWLPVRDLIWYRTTWCRRFSTPTLATPNSDLSSFTRARTTPISGISPCSTRLIGTASRSRWPAPIPGWKPTRSTAARKITGRSAVA